MTGGRWYRAQIARRLLAAAAVATLATVARSAGAQAAAAEPFRIVWSSSARCGDGRAFLAELQRRTARLRPAQQGEHAITLIVETFPSARGVRGQLTVRKPGGDLSVREVPGVSCDEVESAMALIAALMLDPLAGREEPITRHGAGAAEPDRAPAKSAWSLRAEPHLTVRTGVAPSVAWGQGVGLMLTREANALRPSLGLSAQLAHATVSAAQGSAELSWAVAQLALCPAALQPAGVWDLRLCATFQLGRLRGEGFRTANPAREAIGWSSAGIELQARYRLLGPLWLGWEGGLSFPFTRERFYLEPAQTLHRVPAWAVNAGIGLGLRFF